jgi:hypothetical protein
MYKFVFKDIGKLISTIAILCVTIFILISCNYTKIPDTSDLFIPYAMVNSNIQKYKNINTDEYGIPLVKYGEVYHYNPTTISKIANHYYYNYYETGNEESKKYFLFLADWLEKNAII